MGALWNLAKAVLDSITLPGAMAMHTIRFLLMGVTGVRPRNVNILREDPLTKAEIRSARLRLFLTLFPAVVCVVLGVWLGAAGWMHAFGPIGESMQGFVARTPLGVALVWVGVLFVSVAIKGAVKARRRRIAVAFLLAGVVPALVILWTFAGR